MRFKKGSIVEVLIKNELPLGSWRCAEVVCGNGHSYTVKYKSDTYVSNETMVERVNSKSIRPCPPSLELSENCAPGDVLEVFQSFSWKMAIVCKVLGRNEFIVRLVGFSHEFKVCKSDLRIRQSWHDGSWFVIGKNIWEEGKRIERSPRNHNQQFDSLVRRADRKMNPYLKNDSYATMNELESPMIALRKRKRKRKCSYAHSEVEKVTAKKALKIKVVGMERNHQHLPEKVTTEKFKKQINTAINNRKSQFTNLVMEKVNLDEAVGKEVRLKSKDEDNITCSVGSCSVTGNDFFKPRNYFSEGPIDAECSDAESVYYGNSSERNYSLTRKEYAEEIHRLELQAYRCTIEALHACGPLSWEQETLVTNLRLSLNISNDQHLMELKHLASSATSVSYR